MESQKKVLVVDNDEVVLVLISHILTRQSYTVYTTADATRAEELLSAEPYDAILLDLKMPNGGAEFVSRIAQRHPELMSKIIVVTGALDEAQKLTNVPLHAIVRKPFEVGSLIDVVHSCVEGKRWRGDL